MPGKSCPGSPLLSPSNPHPSPLANHAMKYYRVNLDSNRQTTCPVCGKINRHVTGQDCGHVAKVTAKGVVWYYWGFRPPGFTRPSNLLNLHHARPAKPGKQKTMKHYTLAELASPEGARQFIEDCEKRENSLPQDIVTKLRRAVEGGTDWHDNELSDIVQKEIEDILQERAELIEAIEAILNVPNYTCYGGPVAPVFKAALDKAQAVVARVTK